MTKRIFGQALLVMPLVCATGCRHHYKGGAIYVFEGPDSSLVAGVGEAKRQKLTWKSADPRITKFYIRFSPADLCEGADKGVLESVDGTVTCKLVGGEDGQRVSYQITRDDPRGNPDYGDAPTNYIYIGPGKCGGC